MGKLIDVVRCAECIHCEDGECEMWDFNVVKPCEFCWWGHTADGRDPIELDAIPVEFLWKLRDRAQNDEARLIIEEIVAQWRWNNAKKN